MHRTSSDYFLKPRLLERAMNKVVGLLVRIGIGPSYLRLLRVQGRKTGKIYSTPVNLLEFRGRYYLVGGRGHTGWSRNAATAATVALVRGRNTRRYNVLPISDDRRLEILKAYLDEYRNTVQRFFAIPAGSSPEAFRSIADRHPVFELRAME